MRHLAGTVVAGLALVGVLGRAVLAQEAAPAAALSPDQLDQLVAPLALYPDPLIAQITAAATFPDQIVVADRDLGQGMSADDVAQQGLDPSVQGLAHYPTLLKWLDDNLPWTTQLGQAFAAQQTEIMDAVQRMRAKAQSLGNLQNTPQETVANDDGDIEIEPADPDDIYVPEYDPNSIYYTPGVYCSFGIGLPVGLWWNNDWDWRHRQVLSWDANHPRPRGWWTGPPSQRRNFPSARVWRPAAGRVAAFKGDRGYARPTAALRPAVRPAPFRAAAAPARAYSEIRQSGPTQAAEPSREAAPVARTVEPAPRFIETPREAAPSVERMESAAPERSEAQPGMFSGESSRQTQAFSSRGAESRGVSTPVSEGFHGGGSSRGGSQKR
jgi:hypothetical protein